MSPRRHLDDLFSAAYEDELSPIDEARFHNHMQTCGPCAAAYAEFKATIEELHGLPRAPMPHVVRLPSTPPVAERSSRPRIGLSWFNLGIVRRFPATALAGAAAVVLVILALTHPAGTPTSRATAGSSTDQVPALAQGTPATEASCPSSIVAVTAPGLPPSFSQADSATDPAQPALHLVLAAPTLVVTAGKPAVVYAQLSVPVASLSAPGSAASPQARAVLPCVSVGVGSSSELLQVLQAGNGLFYVPGPGTGSSHGTPGPQVTNGVGPFLTFQVPAGLAPGTQIHVTAIVPAGYTSPGSLPLTAQLTLTTR
jgi:anti-sigma factor RsiW